MVADAPLTHPADRLLAAIETQRAPVCVGMDPVLERLPKNVFAAAEEIAPSDRRLAAAIPVLIFCQMTLKAIQPHVPAVKFQSACFERFGDAGLQILETLINVAGGFEIILDGKRGDIGATAEHYANGAFEPLKRHDNQIVADWLTINSYLGEDGITPFLKHPGHGAFALVRTSNAGGDAIQNLQLRDGRTVAEAVGGVIAQIGSKHVGEKGYSSLGAVVGATKREDAKRLREIMPQQIFLVPGYGAQGGGVDDVLPCFKSDGTGAIVTASRSVIYAFNSDDPKWIDSVADAAAKFADDIGRAVGMR